MRTQRDLGLQPHLKDFLESAQNLPEEISVQNLARNGHRPCGDHAQ